MVFVVSFEHFMTFRRTVGTCMLGAQLQHMALTRGRVGWGRPGQTLDNQHKKLVT